MEWRPTKKFATSEHKNISFAHKNVCLTMKVERAFWPSKLLTILSALECHTSALHKPGAWERSRKFRRITCREATGCAGWSSQAFIPAGGFTACDIIKLCVSISELEW